MKNKKIGYKIKLLLGLVLIFLIIIWGFHQYFEASEKSIEIVHGNSMIPTIKDNQSVEVDYSYYKHHLIERGDVVVIDFKTRRDDFVKRVIALPGEKIKFGKDGIIYINNSPLKEDYLSNNDSFNKNELITLLTQIEYYNNTIPDGYYLVLGDNRMDSYDSGSYGLVLKESIIGKIVRII